LGLLVFVTGSAAGLQVQNGFETPVPIILTPPPDPSCQVTDAWTWQGNQRTDATGIYNHAYPEWNATYWITKVSAPRESVLTIRGRFPNARYMSFQAYNQYQVVLGGINDISINPDPGQNNPYRTGTAQGTYTVRMVFGKEPPNPAPNTFYTDGATTVGLIYRVYHPDDPDDLPASFDPVLPTLSFEAKGLTFVSCAPRPILVPEEATINGRLDDSDFVGTNPPLGFVAATNPPVWGFVPPLIFFPNKDNSYMYTTISRTYLKPPYNYNMVVIHMRAPTFPNTQAGMPPYATSDVRFWSVCQNEVISTGVVRCAPDSGAVNSNGWATFVISDPSFRPSSSVLQRWGATWIPWGALQPGDFIYSRTLTPLTNADGVFYNGFVVYRQTMANALFPQAIQAIGKLPIRERKTAMGDYWPSIGYCTAAKFDALGPACLQKDMNQ
jgi:hypothetical protein